MPCCRLSGECRAYLQSEATGFRSGQGTKGDGQLLAVADLFRFRYLGEGRYAAGLPLATCG